MATCHVAAAAMLHDEDALGRTSCRLEGASIDTSAGDVSWSKRVHPSATRALICARRRPLRCCSRTCVHRVALSHGLDRNQVMVMGLPHAREASDVRGRPRSGSCAYRRAGPTAATLAQLCTSSRARDSCHEPVHVLAYRARCVWLRRWLPSESHHNLFFAMGLPFIDALALAMPVWACARRWAPASEPRNWARRTHPNGQSSGA